MQSSIFKSPSAWGLGTYIWKYIQHWERNLSRASFVGKGELKLFFKIGMTWPFHEILFFFCGWLTILNGSNWQRCLIYRRFIIINHLLSRHFKYVQTLFKFFIPCQDCFLHRYAFSMKQEFVEKKSLIKIILRKNVLNNWRSPIYKNEIKNTLQCFFLILLTF